jgi:hypothetical protein
MPTIINTCDFQGRLPKKQSPILKSLSNQAKKRMTFMAKIDRFFAKLTACYREMVPDAYEGQEKITRDPYGTCEKKRPMGYVIGGQYGA